MSLIKSLGQQLFDDEDSKDYTLVIGDHQKKRVKLFVHKVVLRTCSPFFRRHISGPVHFFAMEWIVEDGCIPVALRLIKFMYTRNLHDLGDINLSIKLAVQLEMADLFNTLEMIHLMKPSPPRKPADTPIVCRRITRSQTPMITRSKKRRRK